MVTLRRLAARLRPHRREMLAFARELIALPTENPPGTAYAECARLLGARLPKLGLQLDSHAPRPCVRAQYGPHGPHEFVPVQNIEKCALVYALTAARLLGAS